MESKETPETTAPQGAQALQPTSLADIKAKIKAEKEGEPIQLPNGLVFRLTKPSISRLIKEGVFPSELVSSAIKLDSNKMEPANRDEYLQYLKVIDTVVVKAAVHPRIAPEGEEVGDDAISITDLDDTNKIAIYMYAQTGVKPYHSFREEQGNPDPGSSLPPISEPQA